MGLGIIAGVSCCAFFECLAAVRVCCCVCCKLGLVEVNLLELNVVMLQVVGQVFLGVLLVDAVGVLVFAHVLLLGLLSDR